MAASAVPHVVVIDRSTVYADLISGHLAFAGDQTTAVTGPDVFLPQVLTLVPDLIVLDLVADDDRRGWDFLRRLRREPAGQAVPILVSTPGARIDLARDGAELDALGATILAGFAITDHLPDAVRLALDPAPGTRRRAAAA